MIKNLFKKRDEETIDIQTLSTVSHAELSQIVIKFHSELREAGQKLEAQVESLKQLKNSNDELSLYKTHSESLQGCIQQMSIENESYKTLIESRNQELKYYKEKVGELEKITESAKNIPSILAELEIFRSKAKEFQEKAAVLAAEKENYLKERANIDSDLKLLNKRQEDYLKRIQDLENSVKAKNDEYFKLKQEGKGIKARLKEKEAEAKEVDAVVKGKAHRITELESQLAINKKQLEVLKKDFEESEAKIESLTEVLKSEQQGKSSAISQIKEKLEKETSEKLESLTHNLLKTTEDYKIKITTLEIERSSNFSQIQQLTNELEESKKSLKNAEEGLVISQQKRNLAKEELLKVTQKLESSHHERPPPIKPIHGFVQVNSSTSSMAEHKAVNVIKSQLDTLYKALMDLMLSANTTRDAISKNIMYQIGSEDFSKFEKDLNKIVMNAHEAAENPNFVEQGSAWSGRFSNWAPSKFFSCISNDRQSDRNNTSNAPEKRRSSYKGFF